VIIASVFPIFFADYAAEGSERAIERYTLATTSSLLVVALLAPLLGAIADYAGIKKKMLAAFVAVGSAATGAMFFIGPGDWVFAAVCFGVGNIGVAGSVVFADALLPSVAKGKELDRLATSSFGLGYLSGGLLLILAVGAALRPELFGFPSGEGLAPEQASLPARTMFAFTAVWWALFSLPILLRVREPMRVLAEGERSGENVFGAAFRRLATTLRELRKYKHTALLLVAFLIYNDGVLTIIRMATIYGNEIGIERGDLILAVLLVQFVAIPFSIAFGALAGRWGAKRAILCGLAIYLVICVLGWRMSTATEFYVLAALVGTAQGGVQALSRSLFASMVPLHKSGEFFGLFGVLEKFAGVIGPAVFGLAIVLTGSSRNGMIALIAFFIVGGVLLSRVDVDEGRRVARGAE
jgi:UMF1 family MFS transporter